MTTVSDFLRIVFVCSGNICRSPMAEALTRSMLEQRDLEAAVISAGTLNLVGRTPADHAVQALDEIDVELSGHASQGVNRNLMRHADYIVAMAPRHVAYLEENLPQMTSKIVRMWEYADPERRPRPEAIADPVGQDLDTFREARDLLVECLESFLEELEASHRGE